MKNARTKHLARRIYELGITEPVEFPTDYVLGYFAGMIITSHNPSTIRVIHKYRELYFKWLKEV